jgi:TatD DNase family protein
VSFKNATALREAAALTPPTQMLVETDAPYLTPLPYRGRPNAPYLIPLTVRALAAATGAAEDALCAAISAAGERVFGPW